MRNVTKFVATAAFGAAIVMSGAAPSYATSANVTSAAQYFFDCLKKLGTEDTCGGPHTMDTGTGSIYSGAGPGSFDNPCWYNEIYIDGECYCWWEVKGARKGS
jgi:hypothetical protein